MQGAWCSISGQGTKILHAMQCWKKWGLKKKKIFLLHELQALYMVYVYLFLERKSEVGVSALLQITRVTVRTHFDLNG